MFTINRSNTNPPYTILNHAQQSVEEVSSSEESSSSGVLSWIKEQWDSLTSFSKIDQTTLISEHLRFYPNTRLTPKDGFNYKSLTPFKEGYLRVSPTHQIYYAVYGNPDSKKVVIFNHGGPGGKSSKQSLTPYNPDEYQVILWDQRGSGKSLPLAGTTPFDCHPVSNSSVDEECTLIPVGEVPENTTDDMIQDMEKLRRHLNFEAWDVSGVSWGATLAFLYSKTFPQRVKGLNLRGIFLNRPETKDHLSDFDWLYSDKVNSASKLFPKQWEEFIAPLKPEERHTPHVGYSRLFKDPTLSRAKKIELAKIWGRWEETLIGLEPPPPPPDSTQQPNPEQDRDDLASALISVHYGINKLFFKTPNPLLENIESVPPVPIVITHAENDMVCPLSASIELYLALESQPVLSIIKDGQHWGGNPNIRRASIDAVSFLETMKKKQEDDNKARAVFLDRKFAKWNI